MRPKYVDRPPWLLYLQRMTAQEYKRRRKAVDASQRQIASVADCSDVTVCLFETGQHTPSSQMMARLVAALRTLELARAAFDGVIEASSQGGE